MAGVPFVFGNATTSIPLSNLDANFNTGVTIGNTTVGLGNTVTTLGNVTLNNVTINSGTSNVSPANVVATTLTIGGVALGAGNASQMKNRIINGAMVIDQRNAGAAISAANLTGYTVDRWSYTASQTLKFTAQQNQGSVTPPAGFTNYLGFASQTAFSPAATDFTGVFQAIEGFNWQDLGFGTANAKTITASFQVYSSLTGTFSGALRVYGSSRSYPFSYSVPTANTWTQISVTMAGDTGGTYNTGNNGAVLLTFNLGSGSNFLGTGGAWTASNLFGTTGSVNIAGTNGATFYITGVQLEVGSSATGFEYRQYQQELALCQRYACSTFPIGTAWAQNSGANGGVMTFYQPVYGGISAFFYPVQMRTAPTVTFYNPSGANSNWYLNNAATESSGTYGISATSVGTLITTVGNATNQYARVHVSASAEL